MTLKLETIVCPLCKSPQFDHVATRFDKLDIVRCRQCNLAYINPRPTAEEIAKMYEESYYAGSADRAVGYVHHRPSALSIRYCAPYSWKLLLEETSLVNMRALDIGCAFGQWVYWMSKSGAKALGIDITAEGVNWGREKLGLDLRQATLESLDEPQESFDVITMVDLIEHIAELDSFMNRLTSLLKPGGLVFVQTPNFGTYQTWGDRCSFLRYSLDHLLYFDIASLDNLFAKYNMFPTRETLVLCTIPCDVTVYLELCKATSRFKSWIRRHRVFDFPRLIRAKLLKGKNVYRYDESGLEGSIMVGSYRKRMP